MNCFEFRFVTCSENGVLSINRRKKESLVSEVRERNASRFVIDHLVEMLG